VWVAFAFALLAGAALVAAWRSSALAMPVARTVRNDVSTRIASNRQVEPSDPHIVARVDSFVREAKVTPGTVVMHGHPLLRLDATELRAQLARAREGLCQRSRPQVVAVPRTAVRAAGERRYVFLVKDRRLEGRSITGGIAGTSEYDVLQGLSEGDLVRFWRLDAAEGHDRQDHSSMNRAMAFLLTALLAPNPVQRALEPVVIAQEQFDRGEYTFAVDTLSTALAENPHDARLFHWRSRCYLEMKDYTKAIADAERAVAERPDSSEYRRWSGRAYGGGAEQAKSLSLARKVKAAFEAAVKLDASNVDARRDLAEFYLEAPWIVGGDRGKALKEADAIARLDQVAGYLAHASYSRHEKRLDEAEANYQRALALRPGWIGPYLEAADFYEERADAAKFANAVEQGGRVAPGDVRLLYYKGVSLVLANQNLIEGDRLIRSYLAAAPRRSDFPSHAAAEHWLGRLNECLGNVDVAEQAYRAALALEPGRKPSREALSRLGATGLGRCRDHERF
jgi:tetratricopeptide (TPR) repeat protein